MVDSEWVTVTLAAKRLGITRTAVYNRIKRGTLQTQTDNHGHQLVSIVDTVARDTLRHVTRDTVTVGLIPEVPTELRQPTQDASEVVPLSLHRETVAALQATAKEAEERHRADMAQERDQMARQLAERDSLHLGAIERLQAQAALERALWLERVDAAELRAERVEQRLDQVLDHLLQRQPEREPWWKRWFGISKRSKIGAG